MTATHSPFFEDRSSGTIRSVKQKPTRYTIFYWSPVPNSGIGAWAGDPVKKYGLHLLLPNRNMFSKITC
ncbi:hypothetical protein ED312_09735 [Sinomicrobium pectinilyticum]|uniref:Uncharacterized protein n=1 Tax=Sinomicrobium pectinilyticum TaxID=1084421 RepID=A0A3N0EJ26_SINP1|nr:hypothetical protein ED312_09735 [Sinomicrobium pectinilyticum]